MNIRTHLQTFKICNKHVSIYIYIMNDSLFDPIMILLKGKRSSQTKKSYDNSAYKPIVFQIL